MSSFVCTVYMISTVYAQTTTEGTTTSSFTSTSTTSTTDAYPIYDVADNLYGPSEFTTLDWILSLIILGIVLGVCLFIYGCIKYKLSHPKSSSPMSKKRDLEMVASSSGHPRPSGDGYRSTASSFNAALAGVSMKKKESQRNITNRDELT